MTEKPGTGVFIWKSLMSYQMSTNMTGKGLDGFQKSLHPCSLDKSSLSIGRVKPQMATCSGGRTTNCPVVNVEQVLWY